MSSTSAAPASASNYINEKPSNALRQTGSQFQSQHDMSDPVRALTEYAWLMLRHTQQQMDIACRNARKAFPEQLAHGQTRHTMTSVGNMDPPRP